MCSRSRAITSCRSSTPRSRPISISCTCATRRLRSTWPTRGDGSPATPASRSSPAGPATPMRSARCSPRVGAESPMVLLSGHAATWELGRGGFQEIRQADMAAPVTKASWTATSAATLGDDVGKAIRIATSGRPGPVHLSLPSDLLEERVESNAIVWPEPQSTAAAAPRSPRRSPTRSWPPSPAPRGRSSSPVRSCRACSGRALLGQTRSRDQGAGRDHGEPARHRRRHARRIRGSDAARRSDRAARQGARLHDPMGIGPGVRSRRATDRDRSRPGAGRARGQTRRATAC